MNEEKHDWQWWTIGTLKEGLAHLALAVVIWFVLWAGYVADLATLGVGLWFGGREGIDLEEELFHWKRTTRPAVNLFVAALVVAFCLKIGGPLHASVGLSCWLLSRHARRAEILTLPVVWHGLGFKSEAPLRPAPMWSVEQLRHALSGCVPVWCVCVPLWFIL